MAKAVLILEVLPAAWASALVKNDWSRLDFYEPESAQEARQWLEENSELQVFYCDSEPYAARYKGTITMVSDYICGSKL